MTARIPDQVPESSADVELTVGDRLRAIRKQANLTQKAFADALGYTPRSIVGWEADKVEMPIKALKIIREKFNISPEWVVLGADPEPQQHIGAIDWSRYNAIVNDVASVVVDLEGSLTAERQTAICQSLFDEGTRPGHANRRLLRNLLPILLTADQ